MTQVQDNAIVKKTSYWIISSGISVMQAEFFKHFTEANHHRFLEDIYFQSIERKVDYSRVREGFWQFILHNCILERLNVEFFDLQ